MSQSPMFSHEPYHLVQVRLLGPLSITRANTTTELPSSNKARSLLAYLLFHRDKHHARSILADHFWPDLNEQKGRRVLSHTLWQVRQTLSEAIVSSNTENIWIAEEANIDVDAITFLNLIQNTRASTFAAEYTKSWLYQAIDLYRGFLLEGMYDPWIDEPRLHVQDLYIWALQQLMKLEKAAGQLSQSLILARKLLQLNPLQEEVHKEILQLYVLLGRSEEAVKQYHSWHEHLQTEWDIVPEANTVALVGTIDQQPLVSGQHPIEPEVHSLNILHSHTKGLSLPLIGRLPELTRLDAHLQSILSEPTSACGGLIIISGEAGIGKTRIVQEFLSRLKQHHIHLLQGAYVEQQMLQPYTALIQAIQAGLSPLRVKKVAHLLAPVWLQVLSEVIPVLKEWLPDLGTPSFVPKEQAQGRLQEAFIRFLLHWSRVEPVVFILEDIHWADVGTLSLLPRLAQRVQAERLLIVCTYRDPMSNSSLHNKLDNLDQSSLLDKLMLLPLHQIETAELVRCLLGISYPLPGLEHHIYNLTNGNPFFVQEMLHSMYEEGFIYQNGLREWGSFFESYTTVQHNVNASTDVKQAILKRIARLSPPQRQVLHIAAILGQRISFDLLVQVCDRETNDLFTLLHQLVHLEFLAETPDVLTFRHSIIWKVTYQQIDLTERQRLHALVLNIAEMHDPDNIELLLHHSQQGLLWAKAVHYAKRAGDGAAARYVYHTALDYYDQAWDMLQTRALSLGDDDLVFRFHLLAAQQKILRHLGIVTAQELTLSRMERVTQQLEDIQYTAQFTLCKAEFLVQINQPDAAIQNIQQICAYVQNGNMLIEEAHMYVVLGYGYRDLRQGVDAEQAWLHALRVYDKLARSAPSPALEYEIGNIHFHLAAINRDMGYLDKVKQYHRKLDAYANTTQNPLLFYHAAGVMSCVAQDEQNRLDYVEQSLHWAQMVGSPLLEMRVLSLLGNVYYSLPDYITAIQKMRQALNIALDLNIQKSVITNFSNMALLYHEIGQKKLALNTVTEGLNYGRKGEFFGEDIGLWLTLSLLYLDQGEVISAQNTLIHLPSDVLIDVYYNHTLSYGLGRVSLASNDIATSRHHFRNAIQSAKDYGRTILSLAYTSFLALCHYYDGDLIKASSLSQHIIDSLPDDIGGPELHTICLHHWHIMRAVGEFTQAYKALERAYNDIQRLKETLPNQEWQEAYLTNVAHNRQIITIYHTHQDRAQSGQVRVRLPRIDATTGRPLHPDEFADVIWTVSTPDDQHIEDKAARRQHRLARLADEAQRQGAIPTVENLVAVLNVSEKTIRRDINTLRKRGYDIITRGSHKHRQSKQVDIC